MTNEAPSLFEDSMARATRHHELEMWRASQTVVSHVPPHEGRQELLDCLGLTDVVRPAHL